jgi:hypothetical protein
MDLDTAIANVDESISELVGVLSKALDSPIAAGSDWERQALKATSAALRARDQLRRTRVRATVS